MVRKLCLAAALMASASAAYAAPPPLRESVSICDPNQTPSATSCVSVANGALNVSGGGSSSIGTQAAPDIIGGTAGTPATQGTGVAGPGSLNIYAGGGFVTAYQAGQANTATNPFYFSPGTGAVFAVSATALPLPAGASTSALQSSTQAAPGSNSTAATGVQGVSGGVPVPVSGTVTTSNPPTNYALETGGNLATIATNTGVHAVTNAGTFAVQNTAATPVGANSIGTVGLNAGTNAIGSITNTGFSALQGGAANTTANPFFNQLTAAPGVRIGTTAIDQTTPGTTNAMSAQGSANLPLTQASTGELASPKAGTANRVVTKTSLVASTSTTICPAATNPISTEIFTTVAALGISLSGGALTTATVGTAAGTAPDIAIASANSEYITPVGVTNAITGYDTTAGVVVCIQTLRQ